MAKVSIRKIAQALNLAPATVFRALSNNSNVAIETRRKIISYAKKVGYNLPNHNCKSIAIIVPHFNFIGYVARMLPELEKSLQNFGYRALIISEKDLAVLNDHMFDGIISMVWNEGEILQLPKKNPIPVVALNAAFNRQENISLVASDNGGFQTALEYLKSHGCKRIFFIGAQVDKNPIEREKLQEFKKFCLVNNQDFDQMHVSVKYDDVPKVLPDILKAKADGVFCGSETFAFSLGLTMKAHGIKIPEDISLLGMEIPELNTAFTPAISALSQDFSSLAQTAVKMLIKEIEEQISGFEIRVPMKLIERDSVRKN
jgi:LacI family transcriptional regulator